MHAARRMVAALAVFGTVTVLGSGALADVRENLVTNGGFERPDVAGAFEQKTGTQIPGWTITGCVDLVSEPTFDAARGDQSVDLNGSVGSPGCTAMTAAGAISQSIDTTPGEDYLIRFFLAGNPQCNTAAGPNVKTVDVYWGGQLVATFRYDTSGQTASDIDWQLRALQLHATAQNTTLEFRSTTSGNCGPMIDAVRVTEL